MKIIPWIGTITSITGSFSIAFGHMQLGYICFSLGSLCWLYVGVTKKDKPLIILNGTFFVANIIGLTRAFV
jgi:hypothetical protein